MLVVFVFDMMTLLECDKWASSIQSQLKFNPTIDSLSAKGLCPVARLSYIVGFGIDFAINFYFCVTVATYGTRAEKGPAHLIAFDAAEFSHDHRHLTFYDPTIGEPFEHLGGTSSRASAT